MTGDKLSELRAEALKVYGLSEEHVFSQRYDGDTGEMIIVTKGGKKIRHKHGEKALGELSEVDKTGISPKVEMVWDEKLNQRRPKDR